MRKFPVVLTGALALCGLAVCAYAPAVFSSLRTTALLGRHGPDVWLVPTNQLLRPWGEQVTFRGRPVDAAISSNGKLLAISNYRNVLLLDAASGATIAEVPVKAVSYTGIRFRPGDREVWASEATRSGPDSLVITEISADGRPQKTSRLTFPGHPLPAGIAFSTDGAIAYVALNRNNTLAVIDAAERRILREVPVGVAPFGVVLAPKSGTVYVSNRGGDAPAQNSPFAHSSGARVATDPSTGAATSGTVTAIRISDYSTREIPVGLGPSGLALSADEKLLAVANGHSDSVSLVDTRSGKAAEVKIPAYPEGVLGSQPIAVAFAPESNTLYAAAAGINALAVLQHKGKTWSYGGAIPTAWYPSAILVDGTGDVRVFNIKGIGNTSNGKGGFNTREFEGSLERIPASALSRLDAGTREVRAANSPQFDETGAVKDLAALGIRHVFLIIKENRTYDQVFGDMPKGNGDPTLAIYGRETTPNHHALAERYVLLDNFYASGAISFDGHHWLMQAFVSDHVERSLTAPRGYAWNMSDALVVSPAGFFWQGAPKTPSVRLYGEISLPAKWDPATQSAVDIDESDLLHWSEYWKLYKEGKWRTEVGSHCGVPALDALSVHTYPVNSMNIPDQIRAEAFLEDLAKREKNDDLADINILGMTSDHTMGTNPLAPVPKAMVADNDLALGRIVEGISNSKFWPNTLILVVEDDAQDGVDHVDGHRTVALAIGPMIKRGALDSNNYNQVSMIRTIQRIFGIPPRTRFLKASRSMDTIFAADRDVKPYTAIVPSIPLDTMNPPVKALEGRKRWAAQQSLAMNWNDADDVPRDKLNRILWWDAKGYDTPYPVK